MKKFTALILSAVMLLSAGCTKEETDLKQTAETTAASVAEENVLESLSGGVAINKVSENLYKTADMANPLSSDIYCADPTGVEYNGRLYVYGTNDNQQFEVKGKGNGGGYEYIKSLVIFYGDVDVPADFAGCLDKIGYVHLKDKAGGRQEWDFPALGKGYVEFPKLFKMMDEAGNMSPYSIEIEFTQAGPKDLAEIDKAVLDSAAYLKGQGFQL